MQMMGIYRPLLFLLFGKTPWRYWINRGRVL